MGRPTPGGLGYLTRPPVDWVTQSQTMAGGPPLRLSERATLGVRPAPAIPSSRPAL